MCDLCGVTEPFPETIPASKLCGERKVCSDCLTDIEDYLRNKLNVEF